MKDIYEQLRERLDDFSTGFPVTKNGSEMKVLKRLFSPDDAQLFLHLSPNLTLESLGGRNFCAGKKVERTYLSIFLLLTPTLGQCTLYCST